MARRKLLYVELGEACAAIVGNAQLAEWDIYTVTDLRAANKLLRDDCFLVGLLCLQNIDDHLYKEIDEFLRTHGALEWTGVVPATALTSQKCRELIVAHLFDFHTLPIDPLRLAVTLGHAFGRAALREKISVSKINGHNAGFIGKSTAMKDLLRQIKKVAIVDAPVLIFGESGAGKELAAQAIHKHSGRSNGPFIPVNCAAIPPALIQSELFGYEKGAFTGASREK